MVTVVVYGVYHDGNNLPTWIPHIIQRVEISRRNSQAVTSTFMTMVVKNRRGNVSSSGAKLTHGHIHMYLDGCQ